MASIMYADDRMNVSPGPGAAIKGRRPEALQFAPYLL
jgi:hypothetical protein